MSLFFRRLTSASALFALAASAPHAFATTNVALGATVSVVAADPGGNYNNGTASNLQNITNGVILPDATGYNSSAAIAQAVEWNGSGYIFQITLPQAEVLTGIIVDADDNDAYTVTYLDSTTNTWNLLYDVPIASVGFGLRTRPSTSDQSLEFSLPNIDTTDIRIVGAASDDNICIDNTCGQGGYAVGQVELFGAPFVASSATPEPSSIVLLATGLLGAAGAIRRRVCL